VDGWMRRGAPCTHCQPALLFHGTSLQAYVGGVWRWSCCGRMVPLDGALRGR
jgi:hypothetical protein